MKFRVSIIINIKYKCIVAVTLPSLKNVSTTLCRDCPMCAVIAVLLEGNLDILN